MLTEIRFVTIPDLIEKTIGELRIGTRMYFREGSGQQEYEWYRALAAHYALVDPASASRMVGVSRNAVYKRLKTGGLTGFLFRTETHQTPPTEKRGGTADGRIPLTFAAHVNCLIPFQECEDWRLEIHNRRHFRTVAPLGGKRVDFLNPKAEAKSEFLAKTVDDDAPRQEESVKGPGPEQQEQAAPKSSEGAFCWE